MLACSRNAEGKQIKIMMCKKAKILINKKFWERKKWGCFFVPLNSDEEAEDEYDS